MAPNTYLVYLVTIVAKNSIQWPEGFLFPPQPPWDP